jgi:hypothetical protein
MRILSRFAVGLMLSLLATLANAAVYFVAHPDDAEFLMGGNLVTDIQGNYPTVIVVLSAGDAKNGTEANKAGRPAEYLDQYNRDGNPYFRVRLMAHEAAVNTWVPASYPRPLVRTTEYFSAAAPAVEKVILGNVVMYYLRIPDVDLTLSYQYGGAMVDVEGVNTYSQQTLKEIIRQIISRNNRNTPTIAINIPEPTPAYSEPGYNEPLPTTNGLAPTTVEPDHGDHTATGRFVRDAIHENAAYWCVAQVIYMGYATHRYEPNLTLNIKQRQLDGVNALNTTLINYGNMTMNGDTGTVEAGTTDNFHMSFVGRQRFRLYSEPTQSACAF